MTDFTESFKNDTLTHSELIEKVQHAEEEITKDGEPFKTNKLTFLTLKLKSLKSLTRFFLKDYAEYLAIYDCIVVLNDDRYIKYIQFNFLDDDSDDDAKYKPYIRIYREKVFHTVKKPNKKADFPPKINVSEEMKLVPSNILELRATLFKVIYKIIFNSNPQLADKSSGSTDKFKRRIKFL